MVEKIKFFFKYKYDYRNMTCTVGINLHAVSKGALLENNA